MQKTKILFPIRIGIIFNKYDLLPTSFSAKIFSLLSYLFVNLQGVKKQCNHRGIQTIGERIIEGKWKLISPCERLQISIKSSTDGSFLVSNTVFF